MAVVRRTWDVGIRGKYDGGCRSNYFVHVHKRCNTPEEVYEAINSIPEHCHFLGITMNHEYIIGDSDG